MFTREDWTLFRNLGTLSQKAGVPVHKLRSLVVKELVDNALDASGGVEFGKTGPNTYWVEDRGPGIPGDVADIARLFSVRRPLTSTKIVRLPVRGALGNGLRVVVGSALASGGHLEVCTRGRKYKLRPQDDGTTAVLSDEPDSYVGPGGRTRISVTLAEGVPPDTGDLTLAELAKQFAFAKRYEGKSSAYWYDSDSFHELMQSAGDTPVTQFVAFFDGFGESKGEKLPGGVVAGRGWPDTCAEFDRVESEDLLETLRERSAEIKPTKIGMVGNPLDEPYARKTGVLEVRPGRGRLAAQLPYVVEAWATARSRQDQDDLLVAYVNGTPIVGDVSVERRKETAIAVFGCGLAHRFEKVSSRRAVIRLNVTVPYMPITTDGKEPNFKLMLAAVGDAIRGATRKLKTAVRKQENPYTITQVILKNLAASIREASTNGRYRFNQRQLYYVVRPHVLRSGYPGLDYKHFCKTLTDYEADSGEIAGMVRDPRGNLYHPHTGELIPIGTRAVEDYERPEWTFNKILYCEKEGLVNTLIADGWPERNDCALLSSKGFASRAVRDVMDLLGETDEEIHFFCIHDADASGTLIYQALTQATRARAARKVKVHNLGLDPWEALDADLQVETFTTKGNKTLPVAAYVRRTDEPAPDGFDDWTEWLQRHRVELNAMTSVAFIAWLDAKVGAFEVERKVVPPAAVLAEQLAGRAKAAIRLAETDRILKAAGIDAIVADRMKAAEGRLAAADPTAAVAAGLDGDPSQQWTGPLSDLAARIAAEVTGPGAEPTPEV